MKRFMCEDWMQTPTGEFMRFDDARDGVSRLCHKHTGQCVMVDEPGREPCNVFNCEWMKTFCFPEDK